MTVVAAINNIIGKLVVCDPDSRNVVSDLLSFSVEGAENVNAFQIGVWNGKKTFLRPDDSFEAGFIGMIRRGLAERGIPLTVKDYRPTVEIKAEASRLTGIQMRDYQLEACKAFLDNIRGVLRLATGAGKCLGRGTPVLMFDGTVKPVEEVVVGDLLMGPDSTPRTVLSTTRGQSRLYRVVPTKGDPYVVNDAHILSLKQTSIHGRPKGKIVNVNVEDYLRAGNDFRHTHKGWRAPADFAPGAPITIDPYFLGVWLGDGRTSGPEITTGDAEIEAYVRSYAVELGLLVRSAPNSENSVHLRVVNGHRNGNLLHQRLRAYGLLNGQYEKVAGAKRIPLDYLRASRHDRLRLLAGIVDTDGYYDGKGLYLTLKSEALLDDVIFLARSLGFAAYKRAIQKRCCNNGAVGSYFATCITGDGLEAVPCLLERKRARPRAQKKDVLVTGLRVEDAGFGDYYGFELDGDRLFMLGDFTVTHNTECAIWITAYLGIPTLFLTHKIDLVKQTAERFEKRLGRKVGWISEGEWMPGDITIASVQTIRSHWDLWWRVEGATQAYAGAPLKQAGKTVQAANQADAIEIAKIQGLVEVHKINLVRDDSQKVEQFLRSRQLVICDEAHRVSGNTFFRIMKGCLEATYRLGLTATPLMKESREDNLKLIAACGDIVYTITNKQLIDLGVLAQPKFRFFEAPMPPLVRRTTAYQRAYNLGIVRNDIRNAMVIDQAIELKDHKPIVLVQREEHGQILKIMAERRGAKVLWISGTTGKGKQKAAMRRQALDALRDGKVDFLIASTIFDEGLDEASIGAIILAGGNKSAISLYQRVGRGSRLKQGGRAQEAIIVDFIDVGNEHLRRHADERFKTVKEEEGWIVQEVDAWHENKRSPLLAPYAGMLNPVGVFPELAKFTGSE